VPTDGIPTRARVAPDGRYAAFTVFVTGHSYADAALSTATLLVDLANRTAVANLEEFEVFQDGHVIKSIDSNYWGATFGDDSNFFYATLRTGGVNYLVRGDIAARRVTVLRPGVECPSLSPDGTRVAFKKMIARADWRLSVLDLATLEETELAETRSVDDQAEWLDDERILYALADPAPWMSIMVVSADGSGRPTRFAKGAASPAVVKDAWQ
jgi:dipeptidyl aminopeptidase/acylaminoacyl peptidase